ncbi:hypothetical protein NDU88_002934 [Pleurodeles waltl]|uniref:Uncharacterized protein n=1 Tax=Pleurodeles waltl TaxID=8319 RepID=A0AAV7SCD8_PLEWA|nr:hypothetical protein NDU88_002934 [Pleurodeles waltl]
MYASVQPRSCPHTRCATSMQPCSCSHTRCAGAMATAVVCRALPLQIDATVLLARHTGENKHKLYPKTRKPRSALGK